MRFESVIRFVLSVLLAGVLFAALCTTSHAGVMEIVKTVTAAPSFLIGIGTLALLYALKRIPNIQISEFFRQTAHAGGVIVTVGLSKYKWSAPFWNSVVEPYFVDLLRNTVQSALNGFIQGVESDNVK